MNVFEFAMQMEKDGEAFYRQIASKTKNPGLKKIFTTLADEEVEHYKTFKKYYEKIPIQVSENNVLDKAKNIFIELKDAGGLDLAAEPLQHEAYQKAMDAEKEAYTFYEQKAVETASPDEKQVFLSFAQEERRHYRLLENVIEFISRPDEWLENAEFANMGDY